jgi:hypothetical protein
MRKIIAIACIVGAVSGCGVTGTLDPSNLQMGVNLLGDGYSAICMVASSQYCSKHNQHIAKKAEAGATGLIDNFPSP